MFHPHRQDRHRHVAVRTTDRWSGSWLNWWWEHNPQQELEQLHQLLGQTVQQAVIPHSAEPTWQHVLNLQPEELPTWPGEFSQNQCRARLLDDLQPSIGMVCGYDNHMFAAIHNPDSMTRSILSTFESEGSQSD